MVTLRIPICQWRIYFSGNKNPTSEEFGANDFIKMVERYKRANEISDDHMGDGIGFLLKGRARNWYLGRRQTSTRGRISSKFNEKYLNETIKYDILAKIEARKQGKQESIEVFLDDMTNKFRTMPTAPPEEYQVRLIQRNLNRSYGMIIEEVRFKKVSELERA